MFTMYFLSIKLQLIGPNVVIRLDQHQRNEQLLTETRVLPFYHPYISASNDKYYGRSKVSMGEMEPYVSYRS